MATYVCGTDYCTCSLIASANDSTTTLLVSVPTNNFPVFDALHTYFYLTLVDYASYQADTDPPTTREIVRVNAYTPVPGGYQLTVQRAITTDPQLWAEGDIGEIRPCVQWLEDLKAAISVGATGPTGATGPAGATGATGATGSGGSGGAVYSIPQNAGNVPTTNWATGTQVVFDGDPQYAGPSGINFVDSGPAYFTVNNAYNRQANIENSQTGASVQDQYRYSMGWIPANSSWLFVYYNDPSLSPVGIKGYCGYRLTANAFDADSYRPVQTEYYTATQGTMEFYRRSYYNGTGVALTAGFYSFSAGFGATLTDLQVKQNIRNPAIITKVSNGLQMNYPCVIEAYASLNTTILGVPFQGEFTIAHTASAEDYTDTMSLEAQIDSLGATPTAGAIATGPIAVAAGDVWDCAINIDNLSVGGNLLNITHAEFCVKIVAVTGQINLATVAVAGTGYVAGDTVQINGGYINAIAQIFNVNPSTGAVTSIGIAAIDQKNLGYGYTAGTQTTTNVQPQLGVGTGLTVTISVF